MNETLEKIQEVAESVSALEFGGSVQTVLLIFLGILLVAVIWRFMGGNNGIVKQLIELFGGMGESVKELKTAIESLKGVVERSIASGQSVRGDVNRFGTRLDSVVETIKAQSEAVVTQSKENTERLELLRGISANIADIKVSVDGTQGELSKMSENDVNILRKLEEIETELQSIRKLITQESPPDIEAIITLVMERVRKEEEKPVSASPPESDTLSKEEKTTGDNP